MSGLVLAARLLLAAVFAVAGLTKLSDPAGTRGAVRDFGLPAWLAAPAAALLPLVELAVAVALLFAATALWAGIAALALLLVFLAAIAITLARGRAPECHCFGQVASGPIGAGTIVRNVVLAAIAGGAIWQTATAAAPGLDALGWLTKLSAAQDVAVGLGAFAFVVLAIEAWALLQLVAQNGRLLLRLDAMQTQITAGASGTAIAAAPAAPAAGLPAGSAAPSFSLAGLYGETLTLDALRSTGKPVLLTFTDPNCGPCQALMPDLGRWQRELAGSLTLALISSGTPESNRAKATEQGLNQILLQHDREVMSAYQAVGTPSAVLVQADGTIGSALAQGAEEIRALVARLAGGTIAALPLMPYPPPAGAAAPCPYCGQVHGQEPSQAAPTLPEGLPVGTPAPALKLPDLTGKDVDLADYRGRETAVLFWNTGCGFCQQMLPQLKEWEQQHPADAPALIVASAGTPESIQAQGLLSTVVLDQTFAAGSAFAASGTPSAVKIGRDGAVAAPLAVGGPAVMALLTNQPQPAAVPAGGAPLPSAGIGEPAPDFELPDLDGKTVALSDFRGKRTMLLFWSPFCGFCQQMLQDLRQWEVKRPADAPEILVVSTGAAQENRILGLRSKVLLDTGMTAGQKFGANGTPMAVLVDADGRVASEVAAGAEAVLTLAGRPA